MSAAFLALGSNLGRPAAKISRALRLLARDPRIRLLRASPLVKTAPVGPAGQPDFLNAAARIETSLSPIGLLVAVKRIEAQLGRRPGPRWGPRPIDIDILSIGRTVLHTRWLTLPHPLLHRRAFVLEPLSRIAPRWVPPVEPQRSVQAWLRQSLLQPEDILSS